jgi:hypothetical protein
MANNSHVRLVYQSQTSGQSTIFFFHNNSASATIFFSQNKSASATSQQPAKQRNVHSCNKSKDPSNKGENQELVVRPVVDGRQAGIAVMTKRPNKNNPEFTPTVRVE